MDIANLRWVEARPAARNSADGSGFMDTITAARLGSMPAPALGERVRRGYSQREMQPADPRYAANAANAPQMQPAASWLGILANGFSTLFAIGGSLLWSAFTFLVTILGSKYTNGPNQQILNFFFWLGVPPLAAAFVTALIGFIKGVQGRGTTSLLLALASFILTLLPSIILVVGFAIISG